MTKAASAAYRVLVRGLIGSSRCSVVEEDTSSECCLMRKTSGRPSWLHSDRNTRHEDLADSQWFERLRSRQGACVSRWRTPDHRSPRTDLAHFFEPFYRADQARAGAGIGLGLAVAAAVTSLHGGSIRAVDRETIAAAGAEGCGVR